MLPWMLREFYCLSLPLIVLQSKSILVPGDSTSVLSLPFYCVLLLFPSSSSLLLLDNYRLAPEGVDLVLDCLCGDDSNKGYNLLKPMGRYVLYGRSCLVLPDSFSLPFSVSIVWKMMIMFFFRAGRFTRRNIDFMASLGIFSFL